MPRRLKPVPHLSHLCLESLSLQLSQLISQPGFRKLRYSLRQHLLAFFPASVREELLARSLVRSPQNAGDLMTAMIDDHVLRLSDAYFLPWDFQDRWRHNQNNILDWHEAVTLLEWSNAVGLEVLVLTSWKESSGSASCFLPSFSRPYLGFFSQMKNLREVVLQGIADNNLLRVLGGSCPGLVRIDLSTSWGVDDEGTFGLCFEDLHPEEEEKEEDENEEEAPPETLSLNLCCHSLEQVCIQDTCVGPNGLQVMLLALPQLRSVGGAIYYSSVGNVVENLLMSREEFQLNLEELWDTYLPELKANHLARALPKLQEIHTSGEFVHNATLFPCLTRLSVDFDFKDWRSRLQIFLKCCGSNLVRLEIHDQSHPLDLGLLGYTCGQLCHLAAKLEGIWHEYDGVLFPHLKTCQLGFTSAKTFVNFFTQVPSIESAEIYMVQIQQSKEKTDHIHDNHFGQILKQNSLQSLQTLMIKSYESLGMTTLHNLLHTCPNLHFVGHMRNWGLLNSLQLLNLQKEVVKCNWDVMFQEGGDDAPFDKRIPISFGYKIGSL